MQIAMIAIMFGAMYFLMIRPQQKKQKELISLRNSLTIGDQITTIGGIVGKVIDIEEDYIIIETAGSTKMTFKKYAIAQRENASTSDIPVLDDDESSVIYDQEQEKNDETN